MSSGSDHSLALIQRMKYDDLMHISLSLAVIYCTLSLSYLRQVFSASRIIIIIIVIIIIIIIIIIINSLAVYILISISISMYHLFIYSCKSFYGRHMILQTFGVYSPILFLSFQFSKCI